MNEQDTIARLRQEDPLIDAIERKVEEANADEEWSRLARAYMTLEENCEIRAAYARKKGIEEGQNQFARLVEILMNEERTDDLNRATKDRSYRDTLFKEYGI